MQLPNKLEVPPKIADNICMMNEKYKVKFERELQRKEFIVRRVY